MLTLVLLPRLGTRVMRALRRQGYCEASLTKDGTHLVLPLGARQKKYNGLLHSTPPDSGLAGHEYECEELLPRVRLSKALQLVRAVLPEALRVLVYNLQPGVLATPVFVEQQLKYKFGRLGKEFGQVNQSPSAQLPQAVACVRQRARLSWVCAHDC